MRKKEMLNAKCEYCGRWGIERSMCEGCGAVVRSVVLESWNKGKPRPKPNYPTPLNELSFNSTGSMVNMYEVGDEKNRR